MALNNKQKDELEDLALMGLGGTKGTLIHGFRVNRDGTQVAAVYWSELHTGNEVEVALCESRLTTAYDLALVHRWLNLRRREYPRPCETHKHGSDWPIFGLRFSEVAQFFDKCKALRRGFLAKEELAALQREQEEGVQDSLRLTLSSLRPNTRNQVMTLVKNAGIDVAPWYVTKDGHPVANASSNPSYCFNWAFGGGSEPAVACLWHETFQIEAGKIVVKLALRKQAAGLQAIADSSGEAQDVRSRARKQAERALHLDALIQDAWRAKTPLRVIINEGMRRPEEELGRDSSIVQMRELDRMPWTVQDYDLETGATTLVRGADGTAPAREVTALQALQEPEDGQVKATAETDKSQPPVYVDQHSAEVERKEFSSFAFVRSAAVRAQVLARAEGKCEFCGTEGFKTQSGAVYLETHHIVPLSEGGPDVVSNVIALCPNDHRRAHFEVETEVTRGELVRRLA